MAKEKYQTVTITLSDGRQGSFTGKVLINEEDFKKKLQCVSLEFTKPEYLPADTYFADIKDIENNEQIH